MKLFVNQNELVQDPKFTNPVSLLELKRGDNASLTIIFCNDGDIVPFNAEKEIKIGAKESFDGVFFAFADTYAQDGDGYRVELRTNTTAINSALGKDNDPENDVASIDLKFELTWTDDGDNWQSTKTIVLRVHNDIIGDGLEGLPIEPPTAIEWLNDQFSQHGLIPLQSTSTPANQVVDLRETSGALTDTVFNYSQFINSKPSFQNSASTVFVKWQLVLSESNPLLPSVAGWLIVDFSTLSNYYSTEDVFTPYQATQWLDTSGIGTTMNFYDFGTPGTAGTIGEEIIVQLGTENFEVWKCVREYPASWIQL